jgi:nucleotide-binding universal stress UspA family protein
LSEGDEVCSSEIGKCRLILGGRLNRQRKFYSRQETDFSEGSKKRCLTPWRWARKFEASLTLLYVVPAHLPADLGQIGIVLEEERLIQEARERLPRFREAELDPHLHVETLVVNGGPAHEICQTAEAQMADLIVMGTHGRTGLKHFLLGSVTEKVVRHAPCPVLVVRERQHDFIVPATAISSELPEQSVRSKSQSLESRQSS